MRSALWKAAAASTSLGFSASATPTSPAVEGAAYEPSSSRSYACDGCEKLSSHESGSIASAASAAVLSRAHSWKASGKKGRESAGAAPCP